MLVSDGSTVLGKVRQDMEQAGLQATSETLGCHPRKTSGALVLN